MYDMTLQSYDLFICTDLICINHNFCCNTILLNLRIFKKFFNFGFQLFSILGNDLTSRGIFWTLWPKRWRRWTVNVFHVCIKTGLSVG